VCIVDANGQNLKQRPNRGENWDPILVNDKNVFASWKDDVSGEEIYSMKVDGTRQKATHQQQG